MRDIPGRTTQLVSVRTDPADRGTCDRSRRPASRNPCRRRKGPKPMAPSSPGRAPTLRASGSHSPVKSRPRSGRRSAPTGRPSSGWAPNVDLQAPMLAGESASTEIRRAALAPDRGRPGGARAPGHRRLGPRRARPARKPGSWCCRAPPSPSDPCQGPFATLLNPSSPGIVSGVEGRRRHSSPVRRRLHGRVRRQRTACRARRRLSASAAHAHSDLYVVDMHPGLDRAPRPCAPSPSWPAVTRRRPRDDGSDHRPRRSRPDGSEVAFATKRTQFPLGSPAYVSPPDAAAGMAELFDVDLADDTLTRVTRGFEGGPSEHPHAPSGPGEDPYTSPGDGAASPSFSADGNTLVFSSTASNLVYGDGNTPPAGQSFGAFDGSDVFAVARTVFGSAAAAEEYVPPPPPHPAPSPVWLLGVTPLVPFRRERPARGRGSRCGLAGRERPGDGRRRAGAADAERPRASRTRRGAHQARVRARLASASVASARLSAAGPGLIVPEDRACQALRLARGPARRAPGDVHRHVRSIGPRDAAPAAGSDVRAPCRPQRRDRGKRRRQRRRG